MKEKEKRKIERNALIIISIISSFFIGSVINIIFIASVIDPMLLSMLCSIIYISLFSVIFFALMQTKKSTNNETKEINIGPVITMISGIIALIMSIGVFFIAKIACLDFGYAEVIMLIVFVLFFMFFKYFFKKAKKAKKDRESDQV